MLAKIALCLSVIPFDYGDTAEVVRTSTLNTPAIWLVGSLVIQG